MGTYYRGRTDEPRRGSCRWHRRSACQMPLWSGRLNERVFESSAGTDFTSQQPSSETINANHQILDHIQGLLDDGKTGGDDGAAGELREQKKWTVVLLVTPGSNRFCGWRRGVEQPERLMTQVSEYVFAIMPPAVQSKMDSRYERSWSFRWVLRVRTIRVDLQGRKRAQ